MSWTSLSLAQVIAEGGFSIAEKTQLGTASGTDGAALADVLTNVVQTVRGVISASGATLGSAGTVPDSLRMDIVAIVRWRWLIAFPALKQLQTEERKAAAERAEERLDEIASGDRAVESPAAGAYDGSGNWGSETKVAMRTSDGGTSTAND